VSLETLRSRLVSVAREWQEAFGNAPAITAAISELDAALLLGMTEAEFGDACRDISAVNRGYDFVWRQTRYQVKANRPSGRQGSPVTLVAKARNFEWDELIWVLYDPEYCVQEAWRWQVDRYRAEIEPLDRVSPGHMRTGEKLFPG
jgi:hypothetical protein